MSDIREVGDPLFRVCPICGKPDWCAYFPSKENPSWYLFLCKRDAEKSDRMGFDGKFYVFAGSTGSDNSVYEEASQRMMRTGKKNDGEFKEYSAPVAPVVLDDVPALPDAQLDKIYREMLKLLVLDDKHRQYLHQENWNDELINALMIRSFPDLDGKRMQNRGSKNPLRYELGSKLYDKFGDLTGTPGFFIKTSSKNKRYWTVAGGAGLIIPIYNFQGEIIRLRIRLDEPPIKGGKPQGKYRNLSSHKQVVDKEQGEITNFYENGCQAGNHLSLYQRNCHGPSDFYVAYATEGEKKAAVVNHKLNVPCVSIPGVDSCTKLLEPHPEYGISMVDYLVSKGMQVLVLAFDIDKYSNKAVMKAEVKLISLLKDRGIQVGLVEWDSYGGKGIDDLLMSGRKLYYSLA